MATTTPAAVLKADTIYAAHDRFVCVSCCGSTALYTGYTIGGAKVTKVNPAGVREWDAYDLGPLTCECGALIASLTAHGLRFTATR